MNRPDWTDGYIAARKEYARYQLLHRRERPWRWPDSCFAAIVVFGVIVAVTVVW